MSVAQCCKDASFLILALMALVCVGCSPEPKSATLTGPESTELTDSVQGYIVALDDDAMYSLSLPKLERRVLVSRTDFPNSHFHAISGPNAIGTVVYIEGDGAAKPHFRLRKLNLQSDENQIVFDRPGDTIWGNEVGDYLALSPVDDQVVLLEQLQHKQMPQALLETGQLVLVDLANGSKKSLRHGVLNNPVSWFPDGVRLAYARMTPRTLLASGTLGLEEFGFYFDQKWDELPAIYILDTSTGQEDFFCVGWEPYIDAQGASMLVGGWGKGGRSYTLIELANRTTKSVEPPGIAAAILGRPTSDLLIYGALPTEGTQVRMMKSYSPLRGPRPLVTIKLADLTTQEFQTLVPYVDPRCAMSFGQTAAQRDIEKE